jgi:tricarballylate dehydrogenase
MRSHSYDVVVIGCGMAGLSAGLRAAELGRSVAVLEKAPKEDRGGQTGYSESFRVPSADCDLSPWGYEFDVPDYTADEFYRDIMDRTSGHADPELARTLVDDAAETVEWLTGHGVDWDMEPLAVGYTVGRTWFDNDQLLAALLDAIADHGGDVFYRTGTRSVELADDGSVAAVEASDPEGRVRFDCGAAVLACGAYESSPEKRARYYGPGFDDMKVRGSGYNTGEAIEAAIDAGANAVGQWSGAHMAIIDANAPDTGGGANRVDGYQYGVILNADGRRFVDEGENARAHTYAKFGRKIFQQPGHVAYILLDAKTHDLVRATGPSEPHVAESLPELCAAIDVDTEVALETLVAFNEACDPGEFDPHTLDGNDADCRPPKSNWALALDEPPFYAYAVTGGITFGFGGVEITTDAAVIDDRGEPIPGFFAAGNATGQLFYDNYPGGTGLTNAAVYGRRAAESVDDYLATPRSAER